MCVHGAMRWTGIPFGVDSHLTPSVPGIGQIHCHPDQDKALTTDELYYPRTGALDF